MIVITDTDPAAQTEMRRKLRPRGFGLVRRRQGRLDLCANHALGDARELTRAIDKLPTRQQELRERGISEADRGRPSSAP